MYKNQQFFDEIMVCPIEAKNKKLWPHGKKTCRKESCNNDAKTTETMCRDKTKIESNSVKKNNFCKGVSRDPTFFSF